MKPATKRQPTVLVTDCGRGSALSFIRSLGRAGYRVIAADCDSASLGFHSRFVDARAVYPSPTVEPQRYVESMLALVERFGIDLIVPITDESILPLSESREAFPPSCSLAIAEPASLEVATDKMQTMDLAKRVGVPLPKTVRVTTVEEAMQAAAEFTNWPIVLKPIVSRLFRDESPVEKMTVSYANDLETLKEEMRKCEGRCPVLLQEYSNGAGVGVELLMHRGRPLAAFQHLRLREYPVSGGASSQRESVPLDPLLYDYSLRLLEELNWTGLAMVEFKLGDDGPMLMEINGRVWGSLPLAVASGIDFPRLLAEMQLDGPPPLGEPLQSDYRIGLRLRNLDLDVLWIATVLFQKRLFSFLPMPRRREAISAICDLLNPFEKSDFCSLRDPLPGLLQSPRLIRKLYGKLIKHRRGTNEVQGETSNAHVAKRPPAVTTPVEQLQRG